MKDFTKLVMYVKEELRGGFIYEGYRPKPNLLEQVAAKLPRAHVLLVSAAWCGDCRREVPKFATIVERLSGWTVELVGDDAETRERLKIRRIPTFVVQNPDTGEELGRIVESPESGSLEGDLLAIAERHPTRAVV